MNIVGIIPARWASSRFPGKPMTLIAGKPMIQWVYERSCKARSLDQVIIATDDERIYKAASQWGNVVMTPETLPSGTERAAFVAQDIDADIVINIQGDEPLIDPDAIELVAHTLMQDKDADMATLARRVIDPEELLNHNTARVVLDHKQRAMYFTRAVIPFARDVENLLEWSGKYPYYDQIGIYAYRRDFLLGYSDLPESILEQAEKLEQLRALENGNIIRVGICEYEAVCVDVPQDVEKVELKIKEMGLM